VRQTKFRKSRLVPLHDSAAARMRQYVQRRSDLHYDGLADAFLGTESGGGEVEPLFVGGLSRSNPCHCAALTYISDRPFSNRDQAAKTYKHHRPRHGFGHD
jgi:hypothetical protein